MVCHYRDRADCENNFDEIKNHWGWGDFTTRAITSRPLLLSSVGKLTEASRQNIMTITQSHGRAEQVQETYRRIQQFFNDLKKNAPQLNDLECWCRILSEASFEESRRIFPEICDRQTAMLWCGPPGYAVLYIDDSKEFAKTAELELDQQPTIVLQDSAGRTLSVIKGIPSDEAANNLATGQFPYCFLN